MTEIQIEFPAKSTEITSILKQRPKIIMFYNYIFLQTQHIAMSSGIFFFPYLLYSKNLKPTEVTWHFSNLILTRSKTHLSKEQKEQ